MNIIPYLILTAPAFAIIWHTRRRLQRATVAAAYWRDRASRTDESAGSHMRLLRAAGAELREQGLSLLGQADICTQQDPLEWAAIAARLLSMADDLQDHAPPPAENRVLVRERFLIEPLVQQCITAVSSSLRPSVRLWKVSPALDDGLALYGDRRALTQIILRVLSNAARATRNQDWIEIGIEHGEGRVILTVEDEGSGLLGPSSRRAHDGRGFGLGLAVAKSLAQAHGGGLNVLSVPGVGARVEIALPRLHPA